MSRESFKQELETLINRHSLENESDTPDYILAQYTLACLDAFTKATRARDEHTIERQYNTATF
jgi:hypothetical protein